MNILYIFPHPDDESFGPAAAMAKQRREGHEVFLLCLTKGGATKQRFKYDYSIDEMGDVRHREMLEVRDVLNLSGMTVLDLPDSGLKEMDPRDIEQVIVDEIEKVRPHVIVTYPVHGISGFHDHLITHAVVKRVFVEMKAPISELKRLAFHTLPEEQAKKGELFQLSHSTPEEIDCIMNVEETDVETQRNALDCYETFQETIEKSGVKQILSRQVAFEFFQENYDPPVWDVFEAL